eukprot:5679112-Pleurochrysis_carterae.AAC.1
MLSPSGCANSVGANVSVSNRIKCTTSACGRKHAGIVKPKRRLRCKLQVDSSNKRSVVAALSKTTKKYRTCSMESNQRGRACCVNRNCWTLQSEHVGQPTSCNRTIAAREGKR